MKVLLVEDCLPIRQRIRDDILKAGGEILGEVETVDDAVAELKITQPDLVTVDLNLRKGNGVAVIQQVKLDHPNCIVIVITNHSDHTYKNICLEKGADYFLDKTHDYPFFIALIASLIPTQ